MKEKKVYRVTSIDGDYSVIIAGDSYFDATNKLYSIGDFDYMFSEGFKIEEIDKIFI